MRPRQETSARAGRWRISCVSLALVLVVGADEGLRAQDVSADASAGARSRVVAVVDYVGAEGVYMPVGVDAGMVVGDTVTAFTGPEALDSRAQLVIVTATLRRAVGRPLGADWPAVGDTLYLAVRAPAAVPAGAGPDLAAAATVAVSPRAAPQAAGGAAVRRPHFSGRLSLDVVARESTTQWGGDLPGQATRRYATPATRISLYGSDLPGGFQLRVSARAAYRYTSNFRGPPATSVRFYELSATRAFESVPFRVTFGRFHNPFEQYSGFWDGLLLRVGRNRGLGVGVAAGFEPTRANEAPSGAIPKLTAFVDFTARGGAWGYDTDLSAHVLRPEFGAEVRSLGWSQSLRVGPVSLSQRLLLDAGGSGQDPEVQQLRIQGSLELTRGLRLRGAYRRQAARTLVLPDTLPDPGVPVPVLGARREITAGVGLRGRRASLAIDGGHSDVDGYEPGRIVTLGSTLRLGSVRIFASGRMRRAGSDESISASPGIGLDVLGASIRASWRYYRTDSAVSRIETQAIDLDARASLGRGLGLSLGGARQWGANLSGTSLRLGLWRAF